MYQAINSALHQVMEQDSSCILLGEDISFGGVFRCTTGLKQKFGESRVLDAPLSEQGIMGFACGYAAQGGKIISEIQFADYIYPAFDQIVNEIAKYRYRSGGQHQCGGLVIRAPCSAVGHGGLYHSQSPESYFAHTPGLKIVVPRGPAQARSLLLASMNDRDPVLFLEPKILYRRHEEPVNTEEMPETLGNAEVLVCGRDVTLVGWGSQVHVLIEAAKRASDLGISCEVIDLRILAPLDIDSISDSVKRTGRLIISHEAPITGGFSGEIAAQIQERNSLDLKAPILRACGWDTPFPLVYERFYLPNVQRCLQTIKKIMAF